MKQPTLNNSRIENGKICLENAKEIYKSDFRTALSLVDKAIFFFEGDVESLCDLAHSYYIKGILLSRQGKELDSKFYIAESIKTHILGSKRDTYKDYRFYKFVGVNNIEILDSILNKVRLSHPSYFNDPMDCPIASSPKNGIQYIELFDGLRIGCFGEVKDEYYLDASKWSYYGDFHRGICVEYDFKGLKIKNPYALMDQVVYSDSYTTYNGIVASGLLTKSIDYAHEDEWRIIWYDQTLTSHEHKYVDISPEMIVKIYLGYKCPEDIETKILEFKELNPHIHIFKVKPSEENFYQLCTNELF